jgi:hypothetical protein
MSIEISRPYEQARQLRTGGTQVRPCDNSAATLATNLDGPNRTLMPMSGCPDGTHAMWQHHRVNGRESGDRPAGLRRAGSVGATVIRWWFGVTWLLAGLGGVIAAPIQLAEGDAGGIYLLGGSLIIGACGYALHPWGLQRQRRLTTAH